MSVSHTFFSLLWHISRITHLSVCYILRLTVAYILGELSWCAMLKWNDSSAFLRGCFCQIRQNSSGLRSLLDYVSDVLALAAPWSTQLRGRRQGDPLVELCILLCLRLCRLLKHVVSSHNVMWSAAIRKLGQPQLQSVQQDGKGSQWKWMGDTVHAQFESRDRKQRFCSHTFLMWTWLQIYDSLKLK